MGQNKLVFPEQTIPLVDDIDLGGVYFLENFAMSLNTKYKFLINGKERIGVTYNAFEKAGEETEEVLVSCGNLYIGFPMDEFNTGEDFLIITAKNETALSVLYLSDNEPLPETVTISIIQIGYTSEEYKYLLLKHLQRHFSFELESDRYYTLVFYKKLLEDIDITKESYESFLKLLSLFMKYCADNNITGLDYFDSEDAEMNYDALKKAFQKIGIEFTYTHDGNGKVDLFFVKPDGTTMTYNCIGGGYYGDVHNFNINALSRQEYSYAQQSLKYYQFKNIDVLSLNEINCKKAGADCYWSYNEETKTMTINGSGSYVGVSTEQQIESGVYTTLIIGGNIERLNSSEANKNENLNTIVLLHAADFPLIIDNFSYGQTPSFNQKERVWDVYTDNENFKNYEWSSKLTINWHSLNEWEG